MNGKTSPGTEMKLPSPILNAATWLLSSSPDVEPFAATGNLTVQLLP